MILREDRGSNLDLGEVNKFYLEDIEFNVFMVWLNIKLLMNL